MSEQYAPRGLGTSGRRLWKNVMDKFVLEEHEQRLLLEICRTSDVCDRLHEVTAESQSASPALAELRQQRQTLARLVAALKLPGGLDPAPSAMKSKDRTRWAHRRSGEE